MSCVKTICDDVKIVGKLGVKDDVKFYQDLTVNGDTSLKGNLLVDGSLTLSPNSTINFPNPLNINSDVNFNGNVNFSSNTNINFPDPLNINGDVNVKGALTIKEGLNVIPSIDQILQTGALSYTVPNDLFVKQHIIRLLDTEIQGTNYGDLFQEAPVGPIDNPPGLFTLGPIDFKIANQADVAPWFFRSLDGDVTKEYFADPVGQIALYGGLWNTYAPLNSVTREPVPPVLPGDESVTQIDMTINVPNSLLNFDLYLRYSNEVSYDYVYLVLNDKIIDSYNGLGPSPTNPYLPAFKNIKIRSGDVLSVKYSKDQAVYEGVDNFYFYMKNVIISPLPSQTTVKILRNNLPILDYSHLIDITNLPLAEVILKFDFKKGDVVLLEYDEIVYQKYAINYIAKL
jgi:cytoskeletal protein CcmA (bactofilin family)